MAAGETSDAGRRLHEIPERGGGGRYEHGSDERILEGRFSIENVHSSPILILLLLIFSRRNSYNNKA